MALNKSELYPFLCSSCDELRGGMDASHHKDYVLVLLFIKYVSDKYAGQPFAPIRIPDRASFKDMFAMKDKTDIGDQIDKKIVAPLASANQLSDMPDFNDPSKLGSGKEMGERLTNLIAIFETPALGFSNSRADGDDNLHYFNGKFEAYQGTCILSAFANHVRTLWQQLNAFLADSLGHGKTGSSIPYIKKKNLVGFEFDSLRDPAEQTAIDTVLSDIDTEIESLESKIAKAHAIKQGMMQGLLTGRIRSV
jgi:hypothetical protein